jgi:hypothetical protein
MVDRSVPQPVKEKRDGIRVERVEYRFTFSGRSLTTLSLSSFCLQYDSSLAFHDGHFRHHVHCDLHFPCLPRNPSKASHGERGHGRILCQARRSCSPLKSWCCCDVNWRMACRMYEEYTYFHIIDSSYRTCNFHELYSLHIFVSVVSSGICSCCSPSDGCRLATTRLVSERFPSGRSI